MKNRIVVVAMLVVSASITYGTIGDVWDVAVDFSDVNNPSGAWTYMAWPSLVTMQPTAGAHGYPAGWQNPSATYQTISPNTGPNPDTDTDPNELSVAGHAHAGLRWTSPIDGWVTISGSLFMRSDDDPSRVHWFILRQNGVEFSRASVKLNPNQTAILGRAGIVTLAEGSGGAGMLTRPVSNGDTIDMGIENIGGPGHFYIARFILEQVAAPTVASLTVQTNPSGIDTTVPAVGTTQYALNSIVGIDAARYVNCPDVYAFDHWEGDGIADPSAASTTVLVDADKTITAVFVDDRACGDECHDIIAADLVPDCIINLADLSEMAGVWLNCTQPVCDP